ncbi:hypothetical protein V8E51_015650 [Hyaloscypha variabilis]
MPSNVDPQSLFTFKNGDVRIIVTHEGERIVGKVSSHAMALVSPVWENFIYNPRKTSSKDTLPNAATTASNSHKDLRTPAEEVDFSEDDSEALLTLLRIAHLQFSSISPAMHYEQLLNLAVLCNQYLCANIVRPWLGLWLKDEYSQSMLQGQENWLFIAWTFGRYSVFKYIATKMVTEITTGEDSRCLTSDGNEISEPMPPGIVESILAIRDKTIVELLNIPYSKIDTYEATNGSVCARSFNGTTAISACDAIIYGSLTLGLQKLGLWPRKNIEDIHLSVQELADAVSSIQIHCSSHHGVCRPGNIAEEVKGLLEEVPGPVLESHRRHMAAQIGEEL